MNLEKWTAWINGINEKLPFDTLRWALIFGTYILGEVGFFPFGSTFRLGLGSVFYVICLYLYPRLTTFLNGWLTGMIVVLLRVIAGRLLYGLGWMHLIMENASAIIYYVALTAGMALTRFKHQKENPLLTSLYFVTFDFLANLLELAFSSEYFFHIDQRSMGILALGAGIKGLFFLAFIATLELFRQRISREKEREKLQGQLLLGATLYAEGYFLKKIMRDIEEATESSFRIYQEVGHAPLGNAQNLLKNEQGPALLRLAERIHEIKKDTQRVFSSLTALIEPRDYTRLDLRELIHLVIESQQRYAQAHQKDMEWLIFLKIGPYFLANFFPLLVIVNNILANAIDAITTAGRIAVISHITKETLHLHLGNTGEPIPSNDRELIFLPGFTTKYSNLGNASSGIGLTHVQHVLEEMKGRVEITETHTTPTWTWFHLALPLSSIKLTLVSNTFREMN